MYSSGVLDRTECLRIQGEHLKRLLRERKESDKGKKRDKKVWAKKNVYDTLGVTEKTYGTWERGEVQPGPDKLLALSSLFKVSTDYLLGISEEQHFGNERISAATGLTEKSIEALRFFSSWTEDDDYRRVHHKVIDLINEVLEGSSDAIKNYKSNGEDASPVTNIFTTMRDYIHPGDVTLSSVNFETMERTEIHGDMGTLEIGQDANGYTLNQLSRQLLIDRIRKQLDKLSGQGGKNNGIH